MDFGDADMGEVPTRPMRVKILYTFDQENKTNCLARFQDVLQIPAVAIDETREVGVIELTKCLQTITAASPEMLSRLLDGDFTIYAYDYSEYDTPLVGQGMLSAALLASTPNQPTMITGRVCKNVMGLFGNGVKETLEVKLRLTPVPKPAQMDSTKVLDSLRLMSPAMSAGFDPNAWSASMQQNKPQDYFDFDAMVGSNSQNSPYGDDIFGITSGSSGSSSGQQLAGGVGMAETPSAEGFPGFNPAFGAHAHSAPGSRAGSPMMSLDSSTRNDLLRHQSFSGGSINFSSDQSRPSRPASRASVGSEYQPSSHQSQDCAPLYQNQDQQSTQQSELYYNEDGQPRKRAKVLQTAWHGRSSFGSKSADLRVTAATAASMHMHRPIPKRPVAPGSNLEPPPRVPTPVPQRTQLLPHQQQQQPRRSLLREASHANSDFLSDAGDFSDAIVSSPEDDSPGNSITAEGTPMEIPSSPPVFSGMYQPQPSSPGLPTLPPHSLPDSGYMSERGFTSGNVMETMETGEDRILAPFNDGVSSNNRAKSKMSEPFIKKESDDVTFQMVVPGDPNQLPSKMLLNLPPGRRQDSQGPRPTAVKRPKATRTPSEAPGSRRGSLALPPMPAPFSSDLPEMQPKPKPQPPPRKRQSLHRSRTGSNESEAGSPAPSDTEGGRPSYLGRSGSGAQRRKRIDALRENAIATGEVPQFCSNCGEIETPTWRRLYVKECEGKPERLDYVEGEGETIGIEVIERDGDEETGEPTKYLIRKSMKKTKDKTPGTGFEDIVVCNPCGLWFNKARTMRPKEKWGRKSGMRVSKKQKMLAEQSALSTDGFEPQSEAFYPDQIAPDDGAAAEACEEDESQLVNRESVAPAHARRPRANSLQAPQGSGHAEGIWKASQLDAALAREVQSSPARFHGSQVSPIEIDDLTPRPTRRVLFPSPRKDGEVRSLDDNSQVSLKANLPEKTGFEINVGDNNTNAFEMFTFDKENVSPEFGVDGFTDELAGLFDGSPSAFFKTPLKTPAKNPTTPRSQRQLHHVLKTPTSSRGLKRKPLTPNPNAANGGNMNDHNNAMNDFMTSPSSSRYFLRSTPSRIERTGNTPGRQSNSNSTGVSPWSRHLAQMLSDTNDGSNQFTSPGGAAFDFSDLPTFNTPGREWEALNSMLDSEYGGYDSGAGADPQM